MRILVTGGAGFLGSHLSERLLQMGHSVLCVDNFYTGNHKNIEHLRDNRNFELMRHDVTFPLYVEVDGIFNLACPASPVHYQKNPVQTFKTSVHGAINMLGLAKRTGARFFQASTSEIYGDPTISPQLEEYWGNVNPIGIRSCYDEGKRAAETLTFDYHRQFGLDIRVARIFNTFGPRMDLNDGRVISNFIVRALKNEPLTIYGAGAQTRSFCYVDDLIEAFCRFFFNTPDSKIMNLGNPMPIDMLSLAREIIDLTKSKSAIVFGPLPSDDPQQREPNIERAKSELNWNPVVSRQEGLVKTIEYFKEAILNMGKNFPGQDEI
jgi:UDP-glucuronate decarboxylase